jgi:signal transduction histidine kinase
MRSTLLPKSPKNRESTPITQGDANPSLLVSRVSRHFQRWFRNLQIGQKIAWGYGLTLSIAVVGTTIGVAIGNYYHQQALERQEDAMEEVRLLDHLHNSALQTRLYRLKLVYVLDNPSQLQTEYTNFLHHKAEFERSWVEFVGSKGYTKDELGKAPNEVVMVQQFLQIHRQVPENYFRAVDSLLRKLNLPHLSPGQVATVRTRLEEFVHHPAVESLEPLSHALVALVNRAHQEYEQAEQALISAQRIRLQWITWSILGSVSSAIVLAIYTSRAIARPIRAVTVVAHQIAQESNFNLQAPVASTDEMGILATSLNVLIRRVKYLLHEQQAANEQLGDYNQTLEQQVQKRTQELEQKNRVLEQTLQDLKLTQSQLVQSEKMSSLGQLVAGVAHEINNPVNFIHGNLKYLHEYTENLLGLISLYQEEYPTPSAAILTELDRIDFDFLQTDLEKILRSIRVGTDRIREIVLSLRNFSRLDESALKWANLHDGIDSTLMILQNRLKAKLGNPGIQVLKNYGELPLVECYPGQLNQVLMNLLTNAIDALEECNQQRTAEEIQANPATIHIRTHALDEVWVAIHITDNGLGIPEAVQTRLFDPFFTTKIVGKGTGLGLSISYQIVTENHRGKLSCFSTPGQGAEFVIEIPVRQVK